MSVFTDRQWAKAGPMARARSEEARRPMREAMAADRVRAVASVSFASPKAECLAMDRGLGWAAFEGLTPSNARGFTIADVRAVVADNG